MNTELTETVCADILAELQHGEYERDDVEAVKRSVCGSHSAPKVPTNGELLRHASREAEEELKPLLQRKPVRTISGVSPVAIMTSPHMCPHGKCLYCPGGPASEFSSSQAYTGDEPAGQRAQLTDYDPYAQTMLRLNQLQYIGHPVDKVELIVMGGTMTARSHDYQEWFVKSALEAMNDFDTTSEGRPEDAASFYRTHDEYEFNYLDDVQTHNETTDVRCIGITFETKPDWCEHEQIDRMLRLGTTKVEVGVQTTFEEINRAMHRGHGTDASKRANRQLRDAGFKVGYHMMPGQPGMTADMCRADFDRIFSDDDWRPDYLKIYPTLVVEGTRVYDMWQQNEYDPLTSDEAADIVADALSELPKYVRLQRVQRDIPAGNIDAGVQKSNLRQLAKQKLADRGESCDCIRCREVGHADGTPTVDNIELDVMRYTSAGGVEHFISVEDTTEDILVGFCRLRFSETQQRAELDGAATVRELHVYGSEVGLETDGSDDSWQHQGYGRQLMNKAEQIAYNAGYSKVAVISGIGVRQYYKSKLGYQRDGPYMSKLL